MRVLLLAQACNPEQPSEPSFHYNVAREIADRVDVVVATSIRQRRVLSARGVGRAEIVYIDHEYILEPLCRIGNSMRFSAATATAIGIPSHFAFEWEVWKHFKKDLRLGRFDIVHRLCPLSSAIPSPLAKWSTVPFVIGPVNGGLSYPKEFRAELHREREWLRYIRSAVNLFPYYRSTYRKAAAILAGGQHTIERLPVRDSRKIFNMLDVGFDAAAFAPPERRGSSDRLTFLFVGRLIPFKCPRIAIAAFGASPLLRRHRLLVVGDGPDRGLLEELVRSLGLESTVELVGARAGSEIPALMRAADVFVFPSIREAGGAVVVEAMASGLPCVIADYGGPGDALTDECGIKIPLCSPDQLIGQFRDRLEQLALDPELRERLGTAARDRALDLFAWDAKAKMIVEIYRWVLGQRQKRPDQYLPVNPDPVTLESPASS
jgi:glycosyltransferase involved in cell wall biosynthesis